MGLHDAGQRRKFLESDRCSFSSLAPYLQRRLEGTKFIAHVLREVSRVHIFGNDFVPENMATENKISLEVWNIMTYLQKIK